MAHAARSAKSGRGASVRQNRDVGSQHPVILTPRRLSMPIFQLGPCFAKSSAMATALVITSERDYGSTCYAAFRASDLFPVVIRTLDRAIPLLREFKADVIVLHASSDEEKDAAYARLREHAPETPIVVLPQLPLPPALASRLRDAIQRELTTRGERTGDGSPASSSSREES